MSENQPAIDISEILRYLPHRYPFLLIDRVTEIVLVLEAMAQAAGILSFASMGRYADSNSVYYFAGIDEARFKRPVSPGDQLVLDVRIARKSRLVWKFHGVATVDGQKVAEADLMCALREISQEAAGAESPLAGKVGTSKA